MSRITGLLSMIGLPVSVLSGLLLVGCGDGGSPSSDDTGPDTETDSVADAGCAEAQTQEDCEALPGCYPISGGHKADLERGCYEQDTAFTGCMGDINCGAAMTHAIDPVAGECYLFPSTCIPEDWKEAEADDPRCVTPQTSDLCES